MVNAITSIYNMTSDSTKTKIQSFKQTFDVMISLMCLYLERREMKRGLVVLNYCGYNLRGQR